MKENARGQRLNAEVQMRDSVSKFLGNDVLCLDAIDQPLVNEMQRCIRFQHDQDMEAAKGIFYLLRRIRDEETLQVQFHATEAFARLTQAYATLTGKDVSAVRDSIIPGCASLHRDEEEEAA